MADPAPVAIVTGAASGIGAATARLLVAEGTAVVVADIDEEHGAALVAELEEGSGRAMFVRTDMSSPSDVDRMVGAAVDTYGRVDILHNNAGLMFLHDRLEDIADEEWELLLGVMLTGTFRATKAVFPLMRQQGGGLIVHTASRGSWVPLEWAVHYASAKAGVLGFSRSVAVQGRSYGIRSNAVCPGAVRTGLQRHAPQEHFDRLDRQGWIDAEDVARLVVHFVRSPEATGEEVLVEERDGRAADLAALPVAFEAFELSPS